MTDTDLSTWSLEDIYEKWERELAQVVHDVDVPLIASLELEASRRGVELESVFSALTAAPKWDPDLHPRGKDGKFIELMGLVKLVGLSFNGKDGKMKSVDGRRGKVMAINPDPKNPGNPKIRVALLDKDGKPSVVIDSVKPSQIVQAPEKARLDATPDGGRRTVKTPEGDIGSGDRIQAFVRGDYAKQLGSDTDVTNAEGVVEDVGDNIVMVRFEDRFEGDKVLPVSVNDVTRIMEPASAPDAPEDSNDIPDEMADQVADELDAEEAVDEDVAYEDLVNMINDKLVALNLDIDSIDSGDYDVFMEDAMGVMEADDVTDKDAALRELADEIGMFPIDDGVTDMSSGPDWQQTGVDVPATDFEAETLAIPPSPVIMETGFRMQQQGAVDALTQEFGASPSFHSDDDLGAAYKTFERDLSDYRDTMTGGRLDEVNEAKRKLVDSYYEVQDADGWEELDDGVRDSFQEMFEGELFEGNLDDFSAPAMDDKEFAESQGQVVRDITPPTNYGVGYNVGVQLAQIPPDTSPEIKKIWTRGAIGTAVKNATDPLVFDGPNDMTNPNVVARANLSMVNWDGDYNKQLDEISDMADDPALLQVISDARDTADRLIGAPDGDLDFKREDVLYNPDTNEFSSKSTGDLLDADQMEELGLDTRFDPPDWVERSTGGNDVPDEAADEVADDLDIEEAVGRWQTTGDPVDGTDAANLMIGRGKERGDSDEKIRSDIGDVFGDDTAGLDISDTYKWTSPQPESTATPDAAETPAVAEARAKATPETWGGRVAVFDDTDEATYDKAKPFTVWVTNEDGSKNGGRGSFATREEAEAYAAETNRLTDLIEGKGDKFALDDDAAVARILELDAKHGGKVGYPDLRGFEGQEREEFGELRGWSQGHRDLYDRAMDEKLAGMTDSETGPLTVDARELVADTIFDGYDVGVLSKGEGILSEEKFNANFDKGYYGTLPESDRVPLREALIERAKKINDDYTAQDKEEAAAFLEKNRAKAVPFSEAKKGSVVIIDDGGVERPFMVESKSGGRLYGHTMSPNDWEETYWDDGVQESDVVALPEPQAAPDAQVTGDDAGFEGSTVKLLDGADATPGSKVINVKDGKTYTIEGVYNNDKLKPDTYVRLRDEDGKLSYKSKRSLKAASAETPAAEPNAPEATAPTPTPTPTAKGKTVPDSAIKKGVTKPYGDDTSIIDGFGYNSGLRVQGSGPWSGTATLDHGATSGETDDATGVTTWFEEINGQRVPVTAWRVESLNGKWPTTRPEIEKMRTFWNDNRTPMSNLVEDYYDSAGSSDGNMFNPSGTGKYRNSRFTITEIPGGGWYVTNYDNSKPVGVINPDGSTELVDAPPAALGPQ